MKGVVKCLVVLLWLIQPLAHAQKSGASPPPPKQEEAGQEGAEFFDTGNAPVTYRGTLVKMMLTLLALVALIVISAWMLRRISHGRMKQMNYGRSIKILERRPLSAKSVLYLVEIAGKKVVVAESQLDVRPITSADHLPLDET